MLSGIKYIVCVDTETGGLPSSTNQAFRDIALIEASLVVIDCRDLSVCEKYSKILLPYKDGLIYDRGAEQVHGITQSVIEQEGSPAKEVFVDIKNLLKKYSNSRHKVALCGHNIYFDIPFFQGLFSLYNDNFDDYIKFVIDTMAIAYLSSVEQLNYKLTTCCEKEGVELIEAHRALQDTLSTAQLLTKYIKKLRGEGLVGAGEKKESCFRDEFFL